jgi:outer membrane lipoprotein
MASLRLSGFLLSGFFLFVASGCAYPISKGLRHQANKSPDFSQVIQSPEAHTGKIVIWGGLIIETSNPPDGGEITVLQAPLDSGEYPNTKSTFGQFIAKTPTFVDPVIYGKGRTVTLAGEIVGKRLKTLEMMRYTYPVVRIKEIFLWSKERVWWEPPSYYGWKWDFYAPLSR